MKKLSPYQKHLFDVILNGVLATAALMFAVVSAGFATNNDATGAAIYLTIASGIVCVLYLVRLFTRKNAKWERVRLIGLVGIYVVMTVLAGLSNMVHVLFILFAIALGISIAYSGVIGILAHRKFRSYLFNGLKIAFALFFAIGMADFREVDQNAVINVLVTGLVFAGMCFGIAMAQVFSGVRQTTIIGILRKTYSVEILFGLLVLIMALSTVFTTLEPDMGNFGDALWYCFAVVTTIGFGDITAKTVVGRVLSVILGIYGIIVVALITSIIVNFYNETKEMKAEKTPEIPAEEAKGQDEKKPEEKEEEPVDEKPAE